MERKALGKGLGALIPERMDSTEITSEGKNVIYLKLDQIKPNPFQPRQNFDSEGITELKNSIQEKGLIQPILVRNAGTHYEIIAGERRYRAAKELNLTEIPVIIKDAKDQESLELALIENIQRQNLNPVEEARAYQKLLDDFSLTQEQIGKMTGKSRATIANVLRILNLPDGIQDEIRKGNISLGHAKVLLELESNIHREELLRVIIDKSLSVRELETLVRQKKPHDKLKKSRIPQANTDIQILMLEEALQQFFASKVRIVKNKKRGFIQIEFYSPEDLERIVRLMKK
ncbi:MAG: ParB/RepB/Spo0J family partition protein [Candidatus Omnitrophota bacterium]